MGPPQYLKNVTVLEMAGLAPGPMCGQMLADYGARVIRVDRTQADNMGTPRDALTRGKESIALDLKSEDARKILKAMLSNTDPSNGKPVVDVLIDVFRPGVLERLNFLPAESDRKGRPLIVARLTGYGQIGRPNSHKPGHDINYLAAAGVLDITGPPDQVPTLPPVLLGDFAGLGLAGFAAITTALTGVRLGNFEKDQGIVMIDVNIVDSITYLTQFMSYQRYGPFDPTDAKPNETHVPTWIDRGHNLLEGNASHFYGVFESSDGEFITVGALEPKFYEAFRQMMSLDDPRAKEGARLDRANWPALRAIVTAKFKEHDYAYWEKQAEAHPESCVLPAKKLARPEDIPPALVSDFVPFNGTAEPRSPVRGGFMLPLGANTNDVLQEFLGPDWRKVYKDGPHIMQHKSSKL